MKKISWNIFYQFCIACVIFLLLGVQLFGMFFNEKSIGNVINNNEQKISKLMGALRPPVTMDETKFDFSLPLGTQLYAKNDTNLKLRFETAYINVHVLTSKINLESYAQSNYPTGTRNVIVTPKGETIYIYSEALNKNYSNVGLYSKGIEVSFVTPNSSMESMTLKGLEILRNMEVKDFEEEAIFIGSNNDGTAQTILDQDMQGAVDEPGDETEIEIKIQNKN